METVTVRMSRGDTTTPWGFGVVESPARDVVITNVVPGSLAERAGLRNGDILDELEGLNNLDILATDRLLVTSRNRVELVVHRGGSAGAAAASLARAAAAAARTATASSAAVGGQHRLWQPEVTINHNGSAHHNDVHVSLEHDNSTVAPRGFNAAALPFMNDPRVKHAQYNSPLSLYSSASAAEQYEQQTSELEKKTQQMKLGGRDAPSFRSETMKLIQEEAANNGRNRSPTFASHPNPNGLPVCFVCTRPILGVMARAAGKDIHGDCLSCATCGSPLRNVGHHFIDDKFYCDVHGTQKKNIGQKPTAQAHPVKATPPPPPQIDNGLRGFYQPEKRILPEHANHNTSMRTESTTTSIHHSNPKTGGILCPANRGVPTNHSYMGNGTTTTTSSSASWRATSPPSALQAPPPPPPPASQPPPLNSNSHATTPSRRGLPPVRRLRRPWPPPPGGGQKYWPGSSLEEAAADQQRVARARKNHGGLRRAASDVTRRVTPIEESAREAEREGEKRDTEKQTKTRVEDLRIETEGRMSPSAAKHRTPSPASPRSRRSAADRRKSRIEPADVAEAKRLLREERERETAEKAEKGEEEKGRSQQELQEKQPPSDKRIPEENNENNAPSTSAENVDQKRVANVEPTDENDGEEKKSSVLLLSACCEVEISPSAMDLSPDHVHLSHVSARLASPLSPALSSQSSRRSLRLLASPDPIVSRPVTLDAPLLCPRPPPPYDPSTRPQLHSPVFSSAMSPRSALSPGGPPSGHERGPQEGPPSPLPPWIDSSEIVDEADLMTEPRRSDEEEEMDEDEDEDVCQETDTLDDDGIYGSASSLASVEEIVRRPATKIPPTVPPRPSVSRRSVSSPQWKPEVVDADGQWERDLEMLGEMSKRMSGVGGGDGARSIEALQGIERQQAALEEQQEQLAGLLDSAISFLRAIEVRPEPSDVTLSREASPRALEMHSSSTAAISLDPLSSVLEELMDLSLPSSSSQPLSASSLPSSLPALPRPAQPPSFPLPPLRGSSYGRVFESAQPAQQQQQQHKPAAPLGSSLLSSSSSTVLHESAAPGTRAPSCQQCNQPIRGAFVLAGGKSWCPEHFICANQSCGRRLLECGFVEENGQKFCEGCFESFIAPRCNKCNTPIISDCLNALQKKWHPGCFTCAHCQTPFGNSAFFLEQGLPYCEKDWNLLFTTKCVSCRFPIEAGDRWVEALGSAYHSNCFTCANCHTNLEGESFYAKNGLPFCRQHA